MRLSFYLVIAFPVLLIASVVSAHVIVRPSQVGVAAEQVFDMSVPNEKDTATTAIRLALPAGLQEVSATVKPGWQIEVKQSGDTATEIDWTGGSIPVGERDDFTFSAQAPATATTLDWKAYQAYQSGDVISWTQTPDPAKPDDDSLTPYSTTQVVNDLTASTPVPDDKYARYLGIIGIALAVLGLILGKRRF